MGYRRTDDLLLSIDATGKGTSNTVLEGDHEGANNEGDASREERGAEGNNDVSKLVPILQRDLDCSKVALLFKLNSLTTKPKLDESDDDGTDLDVPLKAYKSPPYMTNVLSKNDHPEFL